MNRLLAEILALMLAVLLALTGCSTHYQPRTGPRLSVVMEGGSLSYQRNGETISHGFFGGGLVDAVEDDPEAREAAETYRGRNVAGFVAYTAGFVCFLGGSAWALSCDTSNGDTVVNSERGAIFFAAIACLLAGSIAGSVLFLSAQPYQWDAINIYNDNAEARATPWMVPGRGTPDVPYVMPPPPPGAAPPPPPAPTSPTTPPPAPSAPAPTPAP